ncbi:MAG: fibronectin type III domain-containing protein [Clostridiales Family XIII bacterium]|jgi:hypothetical protein|nr:fibronectin type III domain-containing protein [Clostridiales Family XIII bacterium]
MTIAKRRIARLLLAAALSVALVFSLTLLQQGSRADAASPAAAGDLTVEFRTGDTVTSWKTYSADQLAAMPAAVSNQNYLAYDSSVSKFVVLHSDSGILISELIGGELPSGWSLEVTGKDASGNPVSRSYAYQAYANGNFYGDTTDTTAVTASGVTSNRKPILSLSTGQAPITSTADDTVVSSHDDTAYRFLIDLQSKGRSDTRSDEDYIKEENSLSRYVSDVTKISVVKPGPISKFTIYSKIGDSGEKVEVKTFTGKELSALSHNDVRAFLQYGSGAWTVHATDEYIPVGELLDAAGVVFNANDKIVPAAADGFSTTQTYEAIQSEKYFYPGTTAASTDIANPIEVGAVFALRWQGSIPLSGSTAQHIVNYMDWSAPQSTGRFYMGASEDSYLHDASAKLGGNRFPTAPVELTLIKDAPDTLADSNVAGVNAEYAATGQPIKPAVTVSYDGVTLKDGFDYTVSYGANTTAGGTITVTGKGNFAGTVTKTFKITEKVAAKAIAADAVTLEKTAYTATGQQITPAVTVKSGDVTLAPDTDYTVSYGENKLGKGTVTVKGIGNYTGDVEKTFSIAPRAVSIKSLTAGKKKLTVKWAKAKDAVQGYQIAYKQAGAKKFKTITVTGAKKVSKAIAKLKAGKKYSVKIRAYATADGKKIYSAYSKAKTSKKIKK